MDLNIYNILLIVSVIALLILAIRYYSLTKQIVSKISVELNESQKHFDIYKKKMEPLSKYLSIVNAEEEAKRIKAEAKKIRDGAQFDYNIKIAQSNEIAESVLNDSRIKAKEIRLNAEEEAKRIKAEATEIFDSAQFDYNIKIIESQKIAESVVNDSKIKAKEIRLNAEKHLQEAYDLANKLETEAKAKAQEISGSAWEAKENAEQYEATVKAMKNIIKGYGDEYLIPNRSVLDELAEEYDHKQAGQELAKIRNLIKSMIKNGEAAECDYAEPYRRTTAIDFVLDAFNGKVDTIMVKVKNDNYGKLKQQLEDAFRIVNHNGKAFRNARIVPRFFEVVIDQLKWAVAVQELKRIDQEEQRRIKEQMREEEKARIEYEKARIEAEKEEKMLQKAMAEAQKKLEAAAEEERAFYETKLTKLKEQLAEAEARGQRALSMAQQTKQGHVYVISNIGSFGDNVFKVGLTRRLEPIDRVKELGNASVPFEFDVHAMIHSENAPELEKELHQGFAQYQVNKINPRKEFFRIPISAIKDKIDELGYEVHWTMKAEATQYRESVQIEKKLDN